MKKPKLAHLYAQFKVVNKIAQEFKERGASFVRDRFHRGISRPRRNPARRNRRLPYLTDAYQVRLIRRIRSALSSMDKPITVDFLRVDAYSALALSDLVIRVIPSQGRYKERKSNELRQYLDRPVLHTPHGHTSPLVILRPRPARKEMTEYEYNRKWFAVKQHRAEPLSVLECFLNVSKSKHNQRRKALRELSRISATRGAGILFTDAGEDVVVKVALPPRYVQSDDFVLNGNTIPGEKIVFNEGYCTYRLRGVTVPNTFVEAPESLTALGLIDQSNLEVRRVGIEILGIDNYIKGVDLEVIDEISGDDQTFPVGLRGSKLYIDRRPFSNWSRFVAPLALLSLVNSTAEPDGSFKIYSFMIDAAAYNGMAGRHIVAAAASTWRKRSDPKELFFEKPEDYLELARES